MWKITKTKIDIFKYNLLLMETWLILINIVLYSFLDYRKFYTLFLLVYDKIVKIFIRK